jgi:hypothetical protein
MNTSILEHKDWKKIRHWVQIQYYGKEMRHNKVPRFRIELLSETPTKIRNLAVGVSAACVACGKPIRPFRSREESKRGKSVAQNIYLAVACPLNINIGCSRGGAARDTYTRIREDLEQD